MEFDPYSNFKSLLTSLWHSVRIFTRDGNKTSLEIYAECEGSFFRE